MRIPQIRKCSNISEQKCAYFTVAIVFNRKTAYCKNERVTNTWNSVNDKSQDSRVMNSRLSQPVTIFPVESSKILTSEELTGNKSLSKL